MNVNTDITITYFAKCLSSSKGSGVVYHKAPRITNHKAVLQLQLTEHVACQGADIALWGTVFRPVAIATYCGLAAEFPFASRRFNWPTSRSTHVPGEVLRGGLDRMPRAMFVMTVFIVVLTIYLAIEIVIGWNGTVISIVAL